MNGAGLEAGNAAMCADRTLPWLQDVPEVNAWVAWEVDYRDVVVLDREGLVAAWYNLTLHDLSVAENYVALRELLETTAAP